MFLHVNADQHARTRAYSQHICAALYTAAPYRGPTERICCASREGGNGAYPDKRCHSRGVPCADVRVEGRRSVECLRNDEAKLDGGVKCPHARRSCRCAHPLSPPTSLRAHEHKHLCLRTLASMAAHLRANVRRHVYIGSHVNLFIRLRYACVIKHIRLSLCVLYIHI